MPARVSAEALFLRFHSLERQLALSLLYEIAVPIYTIFSASSSSKEGGGTIVFVK